MLLPLQVCCCKSDIGKTPKDGFKGNLCLKPDQRRANAKVNAEAKTEMSSLVTRDVKAVGVSETARVTVGRTEDGVDQVAFANYPATNLSIFESRTIRNLDRVIITENFFDCRRKQFRPPFQ